jgi:exodeoxyribonuclease VII large subunit
VPAAKTLSVTQLLRRIKNVIEIDVGEVWVEGEVSNLKKQGSGHWYFTLKDDNAQIQCAMFGARKRRTEPRSRFSLRQRFTNNAEVCKSSFCVQKLPA